MSKTLKKQKMKNILKRSKHALHLEYGCKQDKCLTCFHGMPNQMKLNLQKGY